ncbi:MAG: cytidylate kinase [Thermoprotei archaeon]|nr:MAG: cytidylate kinase [Thermoprotei archaeon]
MRKLSIAISGRPGSGKTTYSRFIAKTYRLRYVSNGEIFRQIAKERGLSLTELHELAERDPSIDRMIDERAIEEAKKGGVVIDGHLAVWVLRKYVDLALIFIAPLEVRARRIAERDGIEFKRALEEIKLREESNRRRARDYYGVNIDDFSVADLVVSTGKLDVKGVIKVITSFIEEYKRLRPDIFQ